MRHTNNFNLLRLAAALMVIISHSFGVLDKGNEQPMFWICNRQIIGSSLGVFIFFAISGYLVMQSLQRVSTNWQYLRNRALRIFPALIVCNILCVVLLGLFFGSLPFTAYLLRTDTWSYLWYNTALYHNQFYLPGVFNNLKPANDINASIWTLTPEVLLYILLLILSLLKLFKSTVVAAISFVLFMVCCSLLHDQSYNGWPLDYYISFSMFFFQGAALYLFRKYISFRWYWVLPGALLIYFIPDAWVKWMLFTLLVSYVVIYIGNTRQLVSLKGYDVSYGLYIYAYPVQQILLITIGSAINPWLQSFLTVLCTLPFAFVSWIFIERPALSLKKNNFSF